MSERESGLNVGEKLRQQIEGELSRLSSEPLTDLKVLLGEFIQRQTENGGLISEDVLAEVVASFETGDPIGALLPLVERMDSSLAISSSDRAIRDARRKLRAAFPQGGGTLTVGIPSLAFLLGRASPSDT